MSHWIRAKRPRGGRSFGLYAAETSSSSDQTPIIPDPPAPDPPINPYEYLQISVNPDGSVTRYYYEPLIPPTSDPTSLMPVLSKDIVVNETNNTWLRLFLPRVAPQDQPTPKLPLILFFHGSGFVVYSAASSTFHRLAADMAKTAQAVVASVEYRLAPEHRLPAAYDDAMDALYALRDSQDEWLTQYVDRSKTYLFGHSAGATAAYFAGLRSADVVDQLLPLQIQGLILRQPFFGGVERTNSEILLQYEEHNPLCVSDLLWSLSLPIGADRDHEYCNLTCTSDQLPKIQEQGWRVLVSATGGDQLIDRQKQLAQVMIQNNIQVMLDFQPDGYHGIESKDPIKELALNELIRQFVYFQYV